MVYAVVAYIVDVRFIYSQVNGWVDAHQESLNTLENTERLKRLGAFLNSLNTSLNVSHYTTFPLRAKDHVGMLSIWLIAWPFDIIGRFINPLEWLIRFTTMINEWAAKRWISADTRQFLSGNTQDTRRSGGTSQTE